MITVVIAVGPSAFGLVGTLAGLVPAASEGIVRDVILVGDAGDQVLGEIVDVTGADVIDFRGSRATALKTGSQAPGRGDWLLFLEPGVRLDPDWSHAASGFIEKCLRKGRSDLVATFRYRSETSSLKGQLTQFAFALRTRTLGLPSRNQGLLIDRRFYQSVGGHRDFDGLTDAALWRRIGSRRVIRLAAGILPVEADALASARPHRHWLRMALVCLKLPPPVVARLI